jgi:hypothetical protein
MKWQVRAKYSFTGRDADELTITKVVDLIRLYAHAITPTK